MELLVCWSVCRGQVGAENLRAIPVGRYLAGFIMILFGIYLAGWWHTLLYLEKAGARLWKYLEPLGRRWLPVRHAGQAFMLGLVWGWLPCGMVYAALAMALTTGSAAGGAATMLAFGMGTLPTLLTVGLAYDALRRFLQDPRVRTGAGILVILLGLMLLLASPGGHGAIWGLAPLFRVSGVAGFCLRRASGWLILETQYIVFRCYSSRVRISPY